MMSDIRNLWGDLGVEEEIQNLRKNPGTFLKEQATLLGKLTKGLILGEVTVIDSSSLERIKRTSKDSEMLNFLLHLEKDRLDNTPFFQVLRLKVPSLNNYTYSLLRVIYPVTLYPCLVSNLVFPSKNEHKLCKTEEELLKAIEDILSSSTVHEVIQVLLSQID